MKRVSDKQKKKYKSYLSSKPWKQKREAALIFYGEACGLCGSRHKIQVHHKTYKNIFKETMADLMLLCDSCHYRHHAAERATHRKKPEVATYYPGRKKKVL